MGKKCGFELENGAAPRELSNAAPKYRYIAKGLNLYGICENENCEAYKKEVICMMKGVTEFDFNDMDQAETVKCPICGQQITAKNCGFYQCKYSFHAEKYDEEKDEMESHDFKGEATKEYKEFMPVSKEVSNDENNTLDKWLELVVKIEYI